MNNADRYVSAVNNYAIYAYMWYLHYNDKRQLNVSIWLN